MNSKLLCTSVSFVLSAALWAGCSGTSLTANANDGGPIGGDDGGNPDGTSVPEGGTGEGGTDSGTDSSITGPFVVIPYGAANCPAFTACGGNPIGTWTVSGGCVTEDVLAPAKAQCPGVVESNVKFEARGNVVATATTISRHTEVKFTATLAIPQSCKNLAGTCAFIATALKTFGKLDQATCTDAVGGGCSCDVGSTTTESGMADAYTTSGNTLTTAGPPQRTFDYCVAGSELKYKETTANAVPGIFVLTK